MQVNDDVICAYSGKYQGRYLNTFQAYKVLSVQHDHGLDYISIIDNSGAQRTYQANRFVVKENS